MKDKWKWIMGLIIVIIFATGAVVIIPRLYFTIDVKVKGEGKVNIDQERESYFLGSKVTLTADPEDGWCFDGWSGDVPEVDKSKKSIVITVDSNKKITAQFSRSPSSVTSLTIDVVGEGTTDPPPGTYEHYNGDKVSITAIPDSGWHFGHWSGDASGSLNPITVEMTIWHKYITAYFGNYSLTINTVGQGTTNPSPGVHYYRKGATVTVLAIPDSGWRFKNWTGDITGTSSPHILTIDGNKTITANFELIPPPQQYLLTVQTDGQGTTDPPPGSYQYLEGSEVEITAIPDSGWQLSHWSGDASGTDSTITVTMDSDKTITANFELIPPPQKYLTIKKNGMGTTDPSVGAHSYAEGSEVTVIAIPDSGWGFYCWTGDASGTDETITVTMDSDKEVRAIFSPPQKVYGLDFSPYVEPGQDPNLGTTIDEEQITELLTIVASYTNWVRTFGTTNGLENIGRIGHELGLEVAVGAWLSNDLTANQEQISNLITMAQAGEADLLIIGSEVLLRGDLTEAELVNYINQVKAAVPGVPVSTADVYGELLAHPAVMSACDVIMPNYYPYWEGLTVDEAIYYVHLQHQQILQASAGKEVIVSETGWPSGGADVGGAVSSPENAAFYLQNAESWAETEGYKLFYFSAFDEPWKAVYEGSQGAYWGIWDRFGELKEGMTPFFNGEIMTPNWGPVGGPGIPSIEFTYVPPYGSTGNLRGQVWHVLPTDYKVAVYIKVNSGWWTKPYWNDPLTDIALDGSWVCDITTGGIDPQATEIAAFLVPNGFDPPGRSGESTLPSELYSYPYVTATRSP
jgi:exo-beta-1,3-glucanase (GH17 family)